MVPTTFNCSSHVSFWQREALSFVLLRSSQEGRPREGCKPRREAEAHSEGSPGEEAAAGLSERRRSADACSGR